MNPHLIGKWMIFGRLSGKPRYHFQHLHDIYLSANGTVVGNGHWNETYWRSSHSAGDALEFYDHTHTLTSRFDTDLAFERTVVLAGQYQLQKTITHFVYPRGPSLDLKNVCILVASNAAYEVETLPAALDALAMSGVPSERIWITISGSEEESVSTRDKLTFSRVRENCFEYTALYDVSRRDLNFAYFFLIHDTSIVGFNFLHRLAHTDFSLPYDYIQATDGNNFNMGFYSKSFLRRETGNLKALDGISKAVGIDVEFGRHPLAPSRRAMIWGQMQDATSIPSIVYKPYNDIPNREFCARRWKIYLRSCDITKLCSVYG